MSRLKLKTDESLQSVLPIAAVVIIIGGIAVPIPSAAMLMFLAGALMLIIGMGLFSLGADMSMMPMGESVGKTIMGSKHALFPIVVCFLIGAFTTIAEPDLQVLAGQVPSIPGFVLILTVSAGVGLFLVAAMVRTVFKIRLSLVLIVLYAAVFVMLAFIPENFVSVAFDAGGVTTGPITVPFIMSLGVGLASAGRTESSQEDSFGLVALCSTGPILAVMALAIIYTPDTAASAQSSMILSEGTTIDVAFNFLKSIPSYFLEVSFALLPIIALFAAFQIVFALFRRGQLMRVAVGLFYTFAGLVIFLTGVNVGFSPAGHLIGYTLGSSRFAWTLIPLGLILGYFVVDAEPAIHVLNKQVEEITGGSISRGAMHVSLAVGVSCAVALSLIRAVTSLSLLWIVIPGYALAIGLTFVVPPIFTGIAFDSGGVASGPMTATFLLPVAIGACEGAGRGNVMECAFGLVASVSMTPLISIQLLGLMYKLKMRKGVQNAQILYEDDFDIIEYGVSS